MDEISEHRARVEAWRTWLASKWTFNAFGTLHFNRGEVSRDYARGCAFKFLTDVQKRGNMFGRTFYKLPWTERIDGILVPELIKSSTHFHFLFQIPDPNVPTFFIEAPKIWKRITQSGTFWVKEQRDEGHWQRIIAYATKETHKDANYQDLILVRELWYN